VAVGVVRQHVGPARPGDALPLLGVVEEVLHQLEEVGRIAVGHQVLPCRKPLRDAGPVVDDLEGADAARLEQAHVPAPAHEVAVGIDHDPGAAQCAQHRLPEQRASSLVAQ